MFWICHRMLCCAPAMSNGDGTGRVSIPHEASPDCDSLLASVLAVWVWKAAGVMLCCQSLEPNKRFIRPTPT